MVLYRVSVEHVLHAVSKYRSHKALACGKSKIRRSLVNSLDPCLDGVVTCEMAALKDEAAPDSALLVYEEEIKSYLMCAGPWI